MRSRRSTRPALALALLGVTCLLAAGPASAAGTVTATLTFKEPEKGSTFTYVDVAPDGTQETRLPDRDQPG